MNSTAFLLPSNSNLKVDGNQISFGIVDFRPHPPTLTPVFASLDQEMDLMIGSLNFCIGSLGLIRLLDSMKSDPLARKTARIAMPESLVGSSSEVNSPVSFATMENIGEKIEELDKTMENLDLGDQSEDFMSAKEWNTIKAAIEHSAAIPVDASKNVLLGYHYALQKQSRQLAKERSEIQKRKDSAIAASIAFHTARNDASHTNSKRHCRH
jgi:hypothetical protein